MNTNEKDITQLELREGNESIFNAVFNRYYTYLCAVAYQYVPDKQVCESLSEDVLFTLWQKREEILPLDSLKGYLITAVRNKSIDYLRSSSNRHYEDLECCTSFVPEEELFEKYIVTELEKHIEEEINLLPEECRRVFCLSRYENKTYEEIANELNISVNTVKYHIKNAISTLRKNLAPYISMLIVAYLQSM